MNSVCANHGTAVDSDGRSRAPAIMATTSETSRPVQSKEQFQIMSRISRGKAA